ncbi:MAG TPA: hypothetical protein VJY41_14110 [Prolixibacteraceae bacterium]|nr:hypothetical protein [Prolixibacteraceae bacterium]
MGNFFHTPKAKQYNLQPRFWDPEKEEREKRDRRRNAEMGVKNDDSTYQPYISRGEFKSGLSKKKLGANSQRKSNIRLLILVTLLALMVYLILK